MTTPLVSAGTFKKAYAPGTSGLDDEVIERCLIAATDEIYLEIRPRILIAPLTPYVEPHNGDKAAGRCREELHLKQYPSPVAGIVSIKENGIALTFGVGYSTTLDVLVYPERGILVRRVGSLSTHWLPGMQNIEVTYTPDYTQNALPADIAQACIEKAARLFKEPIHAGQDDVNRLGGGARYSGELPERTKRVIARYAPPWGRPRTWAA